MDLPEPKLPNTALTPGDLLQDRYRVEDVLGSGGFAVVYAAHDTFMDRPVALKVLNTLGLTHRPQELRRVIERFRIEAVASARLHHPHVVTVFDRGFTGNLAQPFIVMERLKGHDLEQELSQHGPLHPARALRLMDMALDALAEAHKHGIIHKDLKPSNLFLVHPGDPKRETLKVLDFGIARFHDAQSTSLTNTGNLFGTPQYMAPEYIQHQLASPALDVYQIALILAELLSGHPVVEEPNFLRCTMRHVSGDLQLPHALRGGPLEPVLRRALALDPKDRYPDAEAFRQALETIDPQSLYRSHTAILAAAGQRKPAPSDSDAVFFDAPRAADPLAHTTEAPWDLPASQESPFFALAPISEEQRLAAQPPPIMPAPTPPPRSTAQPQPSAQAPRAPSPQAPRPQPAQRPRPSASAPSPWPKVALGLVGLTLLGLGAGASLKFLAQEERPAPPTSQGPQPDVAPDAHPAQPDAAAPDAAPVVASIAVTVETEPSGALLIEDGRKLDKTPYPLIFDGPDAAPKQLTVQKAGYKTLRVEVKPADGPTLTLKLERAGGGNPSGGNPSGGNPSGGDLVPQ